MSTSRYVNTMNRDQVHLINRCSFHVISHFLFCLIMCLRFFGIIRYFSWARSIFLSCNTHTRNLRRDIHFSWLLRAMQQQESYNSSFTHIKICSTDSRGDGLLGPRHGQILAMEPNLYLLVSKPHLPWLLYRPWLYHLLARQRAMEFISLWLDHAVWSLLWGCTQFFKILFI